MWVELVRSAGGEQLYRQRRSSTLASDDGQSDSASSTPQRLGQLSMAASVSADATSRIDFDERGADDGEKKKKTCTRARRAIDEQLLRHVQRGHYESRSTHALNTKDLLTIEELPIYKVHITQRSTIL